MVVTARRGAPGVHPQDPEADRPNETIANHVVGDVRGRICVLVDDMVDAGGTIVHAADIAGMARRGS